MPAALPAAPGSGAGVPGGRPVRAVAFKRLRGARGAGGGGKAWENRGKW